MRKGSGDPTKELMRQAAAELFAQKGYGAVTIQDIVDHAGVTRGAFYHHYNGKEDVFYDFFSEFARDYLARIHPIADADISAREAAAAMVREMVNSMDRYREYCATAIQELRLLNDPRLDPERTAELRGMVGEMVELWTKVVRRGIEAGEFQAIDTPETIAFALFTMPAFVYGFLDRNSPIAVEAAGTTFANVVLGGLCGSCDVKPDAAARKPRARGKPRT